MKFNFKLGQSIEILFGEDFFDLHNCYNFLGFVFFKGNGICLRLIFGPDPEWGKGKPPVAIEFYQIDLLEFPHQLSAEFMDEVDEMGYKPSNDRDYDWLNPKKESEEGDHFVIRFGNKDNLRVHGKCAEFVVATSLEPLWEV